MQVLPLFSAAEIQARIAELAARLYRDYADSPLLLFRISGEAARFVDELCAELERLGVRPEVQAVHARSTSGAAGSAVQIDTFDPTLLDARDVLLVDGVVDQGATLAAVLDIVSLSDARSVRTAVLVAKRGARAVEPDYVGFEVDLGWVVGFGLSVGGELDDLDEIGTVIEGA
jgi:hypoxanthine phosphoribosyltransferase